MTIDFGLTDAQRKERMKWIGGSAAGRIARGEWYELWTVYTGRAEDRAIMSPWERALRAATENLQMDWLAEFGGRDPNGVLVIPPGKVSSRGEQIVSDRYPFAGCTLDGLIMPMRVPVNAKHFSAWAGKGEGGPRAWAVKQYTPQITHEALVLDAPYGFISLISGEKEPELIRVDVDPWFALDLMDKEREFWGYVERNEPPPDAPAMTVPAVDTATLRKIDLTVDEPNWRDDFIDLARKFAATEGAFKLHAITRDAIKKLLPDDVGECRFGLFTVSRTKANAVVMKLEKGDDDAG